MLFFGGKNNWQFHSRPMFDKNSHSHTLFFWYIFLCLLMEFIFKCKTYAIHLKHTHTHSNSYIPPHSDIHSTKFLIGITFFFLNQNFEKNKKCFYENEKASNGNRNANHKKYHRNTGVTILQGVKQRH